MRGVGGRSDAFGNLDPAIDSVYNSGRKSGHSNKAWDDGPLGESNLETNPSDSKRIHFLDR